MVLEKLQCTQLSFDNSWQLIFHWSEIFQNFKEKIDSKIGITKDQALKMAKNLEFEGKNMEIVSIVFA